MSKGVRPRVVGVGFIALDLVVGRRLESAVHAWAGGTCGNVLTILAYLGWEACPIARMGSDPASGLVRADMERWGVRLDFANCPPTSHTPMIVQTIQQARNGLPVPRFSWLCLRCGHWLPGFRPVTRAVVQSVAPALFGAAVFFLDRLSRATLTLATQASEEGALVVFEPSSVGANERLFAEAVRLAHVVKYSDHRLRSVRGTMRKGAATLLEIHTMGEEGLRYRHRLGRQASDWLTLAAIRTPQWVDPCGAGDWCTAGFLARVAGAGQAGLRRAGARGIRAALRYGQALGAWTCGFAGARGGMYAVSEPAFRRQVGALMEGHRALAPGWVRPEGQAVEVLCPACV